MYIFRIIHSVQINYAQLGHECFGHYCNTALLWALCTFFPAEGDTRYCKGKSANRPLQHFVYNKARGDVRHDRCRRVTYYCRSEYLYVMVL